MHWLDILYYILLLFKKKDRAGYIYLIKSGNWYKIGLTNNVRRRLKTFETGNPEAMELIHSFPTDDMYQAEKVLHRKFQNKRKRSTTGQWTEWFRLNSKDVQSIKRIRSM